MPFQPAVNVAAGRLLAGVLSMLPVASAQSALPATSDDSEVRPPVTSVDLGIVRRAREIMASAAVWNRADNRQCPPVATTFSLYCALQKATIEAGRTFEHRGAALQEVRFVVDEVSADRDYDHRLMDYNNDPRTSLADVQQVLHIAEELIALRLGSTPAARP